MRFKEIYSSIGGEQEMTLNGIKIDKDFRASI